jgi:anti-sigma-K factor RskA
MIDERQEELAALHALDLLDGAERAEFVSALDRDTTLAALVVDLRESSAALAHIAPAAEPPAALRRRVLTSVAESKTENQRSKIIAFSALLPWLAAACFAVTTAWFGQLYYMSSNEAGLLRDQQALADLALKSIRTQLATERLLVGRQLADLDTQLKTQGDLASFKITALASLLKNSPEALAIAVWNPTTQQGVLQVDKLPALAADKDYQLWVVDPQYPNPVDGGVFTVDAQTGVARVQFKAKQPVKAINAFAVTLERKGGVPKAEGPFVLLGK